MSALPVVTSALLDLPGVRHAFFTREGGVSKGIYESLNVGRGSGDEAADVVENRARAARQRGEYDGGKQHGTHGGALSSRSSR